MAETQVAARPMRELGAQVRRGWQRIRNAKSPGLYLVRLLGRPLPDRLYMQIGHRVFFGFWPDFDRPLTLSEHIMSYMLRCRDPLLKVAADKVRMREYVAQHVGAKYLVPLYGVWERADDIPLESLPRPCVLKPSAASGLVTFLRPGDNTDPDELRETLRDWLRRDYSRNHREWSYKGIRQRIVAEKMLLDHHGQPPPDYKLWVIGGKVRIITVDRNRFTQRTRNVYRADWEMVEATQYPCANHPADPRPPQLAHMIAIAERLAARFEFLRVDAYLNGTDSMYIGEFTVSPGAGYEKFEPASFARELGRYWTPRSTQPPT